MQIQFCVELPSLIHRTPLAGILVLLLELCALPCQAAVSDEGFLDMPIERFEAAIGTEFWSLCETLNRPCGMEMAQLYDLSPIQTGGPERLLKPPDKVRLAKVKPREILDAFIAKYPGYRWALKNGVINVEPIKREGEDVLSRRLRSVSISGLTSFKAALHVLRQADIATTWTLKGRIRYGFVDLELKNVSVREALNEIARAEGQVGWIFVLRTSTGRSFSMPTWKDEGTMSIEERRNPKQ